MSWLKKTVHKAIGSAAKAAGKVAKAVTGSNKVQNVAEKAVKAGLKYAAPVTSKLHIASHIPDLLRLKGPDATEPLKGAGAEEGGEEYDYSEYFAAMKEALQAQAEAASFVPDSLEPLKNAVDETGNAIDDIKRKQQRRSGVLSLYKRYLDSGYAWKGGGAGTALGGTSALGA